MTSKSDEILTDNEVILVVTPSSKNSTLTHILESEVEEGVLDSGYMTPPEYIFDPFSPGPEELCLAPKRKTARRNPLRRQLNFGFRLSSPTFDLESEFEEFEPEEKCSTLMHVLDFEEEVLDLGCRTPLEYIFDAFAPGQEELCLAPKMCKATRKPLCRQLSICFGLSCPMFDLESEFEEFEPEEKCNTLMHVLDFEEEVLDLGCRTPLEYMFDAFAPGQEELCLAPKICKATRKSLCRQLSICFGLSCPMFDLEIENEEFEQKEIQIVCKGIFDLIISDVLEICEVKMQLERGGGERGNGCRTPTGIHLLTGIVDTCPGAPIRPSLKILINLRRKMCRKLNFDFDLD